MSHWNGNVSRGIQTILVDEGGRVRVASLSTPRKRRATKHDQPIKIDATPEQVARSLFRGRPKPADRWRYIQDAQQPKS